MLTLARAMREGIFKEKTGFWNQMVNRIFNLRL